MTHELQPVPETPPGAVVAAVVSGNSLLQLAIEKGVSVETLERLVALHERAEDRMAANEMNVALTAFQNECPHIRRTSTAEIHTNGGGKYAYRYAELDQIARTIRPLLIKHGLSYTWNSATTNGVLECECILRHIAGHTISAKFSTPTSTKSAMSDQQRTGAALTYAKRQSLIQVLGLTTTDKDTDAVERDETRISEQQAMTIEDMIQDSGADRARFLAYMGATSVGDIRATDYQKAVTGLRKKKGAAP